MFSLSIITPRICIILMQKRFIAIYYTNYKSIKKMYMLYKRNYIYSKLI